MKPDGKLAVALWEADRYAAALSDALTNNSREGLCALRNGHVGGWLALLCKNTRKLPQFVGTAGRIKANP